jgi:acyl-CoA reductase-like NAD-dependent aldehyde dehydrogenase
VVNGCAFGTFIASGQTCIAGTRVLVEESIFKEFCEKLVAKVSKFNVGSPFDPLTHLGPVISPKQLEFIETLVKKSVSEGKPVSDNSSCPSILFIASYVYNVYGKALVSCVVENERSFLRNWTC